MCGMRYFKFLILSKSFAEDQDLSGKILGWPGSNEGLEEYLFVNKGNMDLSNLNDRI